VTLIDQRILIPAPTHAIWPVLADSNQLVHWRVDCKAVQIVTPRQFGVGMVRQITNAQGKPRLEEITAWYEGLGYEYQLVEARAYKEWTSRIRLQSTPDGTIVQWTISYTPAGIFNPLMDALGGKANYEEDTTDSLRQLRRVVESMGVQQTDARRRTTLPPVAAIVKSSTQPIVIPPEVSAADTKPKKPEGLEDFLDEQLYARQDDPPTTPRFTSTVSRPETPPQTMEPVPQEKLPPGMPEILKATPPQGTPKVDVSRLRYADELNEDADAYDPPTLMRLPGLPPPTERRDTGEVSIWDAFGLRPPSAHDTEALNEIVKKETGQFKVVVADDLNSDTRTFSPLITLPVKARPHQEEEGPRKRRTTQMRIRDLSKKD
jgi:hypothetical protein